MRLPQSTASSSWARTSAARPEDWQPTVALGHRALRRRSPRLGRITSDDRVAGLPIRRSPQASELLEPLHHPLLPLCVAAWPTTDLAAPLLAGERQLRGDLTSWPADAGLWSRKDLPQLQGHGDATPHNLLVTADDPRTFVVIDWAMAGRAAVGDDLGQLLIGHAHEGILDADDLAALHDVLLRAYLVGLATEGVRIDDEVVRLGMDGGLVVRSAFTALPLEVLDEAIRGLAEHVEHRASYPLLAEVGLQTTRREHSSPGPSGDDMTTTKTPGERYRRQLAADDTVTDLSCTKTRRARVPAAGERFEGVENSRVAVPSTRSTAFEVRSINAPATLGA